MDATQKQYHAGCPQHWGNLPFSRNTHGPCLQCFLKESGLYPQGWRWLSRIGEWSKGLWTWSPISPAAWQGADRPRVSAGTAEQRLRLGHHFWTLMSPCFHFEFVCLSKQSPTAATSLVWNPSPALLLMSVVPPGTLSRVFATLETSSPDSSVHGILQQEHCGGLPCPPPGDLPNPGIKRASLASPALVGGFFTTGSPGKPSYSWGTLLAWSCCPHILPSAD